MRKRTKGYFLLAFLVIVGFAGTQGIETISKEERKFALVQFKDTRTEFLKSIKGLSAAQLNFKAGRDRWSVKECAYHIALSEKNLWQLLESTMQRPANPEMRSEIKLTDEQLLQMMKDRSLRSKTIEPFEPKVASWKNLNEAVSFFKDKRERTMNYMNSTTQDLRNHVAQTPLGWLDCYQLCLMIAAHSERHIQQINEVKADPGFPAQTKSRTK